MNRPTSETVVCETCGAIVRAYAVKCPKCETHFPRKYSDRHDGLLSPRNAVRDSPITEQHVNLLGMFFWSIALLVGLAVFADSPGWAIAVFITILPPLLRTALLVRRRNQMGRETTPSEKICYFVSSFVFVLAMGCAVGLANVITLFAACLAMLQGSDTTGTSTALVFVVVSSTVLLMFVPMMIDRWHRDASEE